MRRVWRTLAAAMAAATMASCAAPSTGGAVATPSGTPVVHASWTSCVKDAPDSTGFGQPTNTGGPADLPVAVTSLPRFGDGFAAVAAVICGSAPETRPDGGQDLVATEKRATGIAELVTALRLPDLPRTNGACAAIAYIVEWFALVDADGHWVRPGVPMDECGQPRVEVRSALDKLPTTVVSHRTIREIESAAAAASGCSQSWADMVWVVTSTEPREKRGTFAYPYAAATQLRRCVYRVPASEQRSGKPGGTFEFGGILTPASRTSIEAALAHLAPEQECSTPAGRFALLRPADGKDGEIYVELDGCRRVMVTPINAPVEIAQASDKLIALLGAN